MDREDWVLIVTLGRERGLLLTHDRGRTLQTSDRHRVLDFPQSSLLSIRPPLIGHAPLTMGSFLRKPLDEEHLMGCLRTALSCAELPDEESSMISFCVRQDELKYGASRLIYVCPQPAPVGIDNSSVRPHCARFVQLSGGDAFLLAGPIHCSCGLCGVINFRKNPGIAAGIGEPTIPSISRTQHRP
jgi:hypothetical protein